MQFDCKPIFFPLCDWLDLSDAEGKSDKVLQSAANRNFVCRSSRTLFSSEVLYRETLRMVPLLKMPVYSAHRSVKRAPRIVPCYVVSYLVPLLSLRRAV
jgi:hypothetical protein